jgi:hypothetical protein
MSSPLEKAAAYSAIGTLILTAIIVWLMWPSSQQKPTETGHPIMIAWIMPSILAAAILGAGVLHLLAAMASHVAMPAVQVSKSPSPAHGDGEARIFLGSDITPEFLAGLSKDQMGIHARRLTSIYEGKWMKVSGAVDDVSKLARNDYFVTLSNENPHIFFIFSGAHWEERLSILKKGTQLTVIGKLRAISRENLQFEECEIVSS